MSQGNAPFPGPPAVPAPPPGEDRGFYRSPQRVAVLSVLAPVAYELWWLWQLFAFTRREHFPRARAFWWILVPIYNYVVIYRQFDDLAKRVREVAPALAFSATTAIWLFIASNAVANVSARLNGPGSLVLFIIGGGVLAVAYYQVQRGANAYQEARFAGQPLSGMTVGEWFAAAIGVVFLGLIILSTVLTA